MPLTGAVRPEQPKRTPPGSCSGFELNERFVPGLKADLAVTGDEGRSVGAAARIVLTLGLLSRASLDRGFACSWSIKYLIVGCEAVSVNEA